MFVLHVAIKIKPAREEAAQSVFSGPFKAAITAQPGFRDVRFLKPTDGGEYMLTIAFEAQPMQQKWVATDLHTKVWNEMQANFDGYSVKSYNTV